MFAVWPSKTTPVITVSGVDPGTAPIKARQSFGGVIADPDGGDAGTISGLAESTGAAAAVASAGVMPVDPPAAAPACPVVDPSTADVEGSALSNRALTVVPTFARVMTRSAAEIVRKSVAGCFVCADCGASEEVEVAAPTDAAVAA